MPAGHDHESAESIEDMSLDVTVDLATELRHQHMSGSDDRALVSYLSNRYRMKKARSRAIVESYFGGFRAGADSVFSSPSTSSLAESNPMFEAAFKVGRTETERYIENQRSKLAQGMYRTAVILVLILCGVGWLLYRWSSQ